MVCPSFPFAFKGGMWDLIVLIPDHCFSIYFDRDTISIFQNNKRQFGEYIMFSLNNIKGLLKYTINKEVYAEGLSSTQAIQ